MGVEVDPEWHVAFDLSVVVLVVEDVVELLVQGQQNVVDIFYDS